MGRLLRSCRVTHEGLAVLQLFGPRLFPDSAGAFFIRSERAGTWRPSWPGGPTCRVRRYSPGRLRALRSEDPTGSMPAPRPALPSHEGKQRYRYLDIPVTEEGEEPYLMHIEFSGDPAVDRKVHELGALVAERMALSMSGLKLREKLRAQSIRDPLTGLFNRGYGEEALGLEIHRALRRKGPVGLVGRGISTLREVQSCAWIEEGKPFARDLGGK